MYTILGCYGDGQGSGTIEFSYLQLCQFWKWYKFLLTWSYWTKKLTIFGSPGQICFHPPDVIPVYDVLWQEKNVNQGVFSVKLTKN